jgi:CubicO group peptidase (beta-lactamase class C family)
LRSPRSLLLVALLAALIAVEARGQPADSTIDHYLHTRSGPAFSGVITVARRGQILFNQAYGLADADLAIPNRTDHRFGIGSLTKPITAVAALRLVEHGQLRLEDRICRFLPSCPPAWSAVTLEHLLSHTSGVPDLFSELPAVPPDSMRVAIDSAITRHRTDSLRSPPGERYAYNNFGYFLVAYAMEAAAGRRWETLLRTEVFEPAGMRDTEYHYVWRVMPRRARGYKMVRDSLRHIDYHDHGAYAAGGLLSSTADLLRFMEALEQGRLLADSTRRAMFTPRQSEYGLGWQITTAFGLALRNHTGGTNGFASWLGRFDDGTTVIVLSNVEGGAAAKATGCDVSALVMGLLLSRREANQQPCRTQP